jgi:hypothetical protein
MGSHKAPKNYERLNGTLESYKNPLVSFQNTAHRVKWTGKSRCIRAQRTGFDEHQKKLLGCKGCRGPGKVNSGHSVMGQKGHLHALRNHWVWRTRNREQSAHLKNGISTILCFPLFILSLSQLYRKHWSILHWRINSPVPAWLPTLPIETIPSSAFWKSSNWFS